jgi:hypothetical protein
MRKTSLLLVASAAAVATLAHTTDAHALGPLSLEVGITAGDGTNPDSNAGPNPLGFGLGARAGVSIFNIYGGVMGEYYFGSSEDVLGQSLSVHTTKYGAQVGYNLGIPLLTIRPQVGFGNLSITGSYAGVSSSDSAFWVEPGVVGLITLGMYYFGADINALMIPKYPEGTNLDGSPNTPFKVSMTFHGQVGISF